MEIPCGITIQSEAFLGEKLNYCIHAHPFFLQQITKQIGKRHSMLFFTHMHTHKSTHYDNVGKLTTDISYCLKRLIIILMVTDKICHIFSWGPISQCGIFKHREKWQKENLSFSLHVFFFWFFSNALFSPCLSWHTVIYPRQVLNINQVFLLWNMIICKLVIFGTEKMWAAKWLV